MNFQNYYVVKSTQLKGHFTVKFEIQLFGSNRKLKSEF